MPHGTPDWGLVDKAKATFGLDDVGEAVVRLGSIVTFDRRGDVVFMDDFTSGVNKWSPDGSAGGWNVQPVTFPLRSSPLALLMETPDAENAWTILQHYHNHPVVGGIGFEISFVPDDETYTFYFEMIFRNVGGERHFGFQYDHTTGELLVLEAGPVFTPVATITPVCIQDTFFCTVKLVFDLDSLNYARLIFNDIEYDATAYSGYAAAVFAPVYLLIQLYAVAASDTGTDIVIDDAILTQNEPLDILG